MGHLSTVETGCEILQTLVLHQVTSPENPDLHPKWPLYFLYISG